MREIVFVEIFQSAGPQRVHLVQHLLILPVQLLRQLRFLRCQPCGTAFVGVNERQVPRQRQRRVVFPILRQGRPVEIVAERTQRLVRARQFIRHLRR